MRIHHLVTAIAVSLSLATSVRGAEIQRMDPPFWYTGMKNHELQVMFYGKGIAESGFSMKDYAGVTVKEVAKVGNPNYLFVYLDISSEARPGTLIFRFKEGRKTTEKTFELKPRNTKAGAMGFSTKDVLYLIMPDRFANGDPSNDTWENFPVNRENGGGHHGGDLKGIKDHLGYINDLGVTAIWLNPVQYNRSNASHGYSISDYYMIDPRLGSNEEYCGMIDEAHRRGIKVVMDMIFNHSGSTHWWIEDIPDDSWFNQNDFAKKLSERQKQAAAQPQQPRQGQGQGQPGGFQRGRFNEGLTTTTHYKWVLMDPHAPQSEKDILLDGWFSGGMPDLNQRNPHLATYLIQNSIWWIEYAKIDGVRMDTYPYADYDFMVRWCDEIEAEYPDFNIVGEGWYPRNSAAGWWQRGSAVNPHDSHLKTVMDFDLTFTTKMEIKKESNTSEGSEAGLFKMYEVITQDFLFPDPNHVLTFLDNHDIERFMDPGDPAWKLKQGLAFLLTTRGIPQIYYGTEIAMAGRAALRADFPGGWKEDAANAFTKEGRDAFQNECWDFASKLLNWRRTSKPVTEGKLIHYTPDNQTKCYVYARTDGWNTVLVMLNGSDEEKQVNMGRFKEVVKDYTKGKDAVTGQVVNLTAPVSIPARGVYVLDLE
ncbi:MAG: cyclomaltodextrinase N-terminal domain-containing protein [Bacteroidales bacterium]|nr:cyclomaltodextrinase N-terminal domain-containing protein [Bacteroidales bacterium]